MSKQLFVDPVELRKPGKITFEDIPVNVYNKTIQDEKANYSKEDFIRIFHDIAMLRGKPGGHNVVDLTWHTVEPLRQVTALDFQHTVVRLLQTLLQEACDQIGNAHLLIIPFQTNVYLF